MSDPAEVEQVEQPQVYDAELVLVRHPEAGEATVPRMALSQMDPRWQLVDDEPPAGTEPEAKPATSTVRRSQKEEG